jgi:hypothetical protein
MRGASLRLPNALPVFPLGFLPSPVNDDDLPS